MSCFEDQWAIIESTFNRVSSCTIAEYSFQTLYDTVYKLVRQNKGDTLFERLSILISKRVTLAVNEIGNATIENILQTLHETWKFHILTISRTSEFLFFFNRHFCKPRNMPTITELGISLFRDQLLMQHSICRRIQDSFIEKVKKERSGESSCLEPLLCAALVLHSVNGLYVVQKAYLEELRISQTELAQQSSLSPVEKFVTMYRDQLAKERQICLFTLGERSLPPTESLMQEVWILHSKEQMLCSEQLKPLFAAKDETTLRLIYSTYEQVGEGDSFVNVAKQYFFDEVVSCSPDLAGVERVLELESFKKRIRQILSECERTTRRCDALTKAFHDGLDRIVGIAEALTSYLEAKNSSSDDDQFEDAVNDVISIFKYLSDKDLFEIAYKSYLAKRLLTSGLTQQEEDRERLFISKFKREVGCSFASRIEGLFADRKASDDLNTFFHEFLTTCQPLSYELHVLVLTSGFWPQYQASSSSLVADLQAGARLFTSFYMQRHTTRRLEFCLHQGTCDVRVTNNKRFDATLPASCVGVLMFFQHDEKCTPSTLSEALNIPATDVIRALMALSRQTPSHNGLLCCDSRGVTSATQFSFNTDFRSKSTKFRVSEISIKEKPKTDTIRTKNDDDRKFKIDAAIVRIMKSRRTLSHPSLITEVQRVAAQSFEASHEDIKRRVEHLLEREFIARSVDLAGWYVYVA
jgi:hypothetical protein